MNRKEKVYEGVLDIDVVLSYTKKTQIAEIKLMYNNKMLIANKNSEDIFKSIDLALDNIERQIKRHRSKRREYRNEKIADNLVTS